jgi:hypothetical protein
MREIVHIQLGLVAAAIITAAAAPGPAGTDAAPDTWSVVVVTDHAEQAADDR